MTLNTLPGRLVFSDHTKEIYFYYFQLTHNIMSKELKFCGASERAKVDSRIKKRAAEYVRRYMLKFKKDYRKSPPI